MIYATKAHKKIRAFVSSNKFLLLSVRQISKMLAIPASTVSYQMHLLASAGCLVQRAGKFLVVAIARGPLAFVLARLTQHEQNLNKVLQIKHDMPKLSEKKELPRWQLASSLKF